MKHIEDYEVDKLLGKKIYNLRIDRDMSRSDLAKKLVFLNNKLQNMGMQQIKLAHRD